MKKIIVIGGGPAGMMAAAAAAAAGAQVSLWERNAKLGRKLAITGKGRCNITNDCSVKELIANIPNNGRFLFSAFSRFDSQDTRDFFTSLGVDLKTERGRRVFPVSDQASDIVDAMVRRLHDTGVKVCLNTTAGRLLLGGGAVSGVYDQKGVCHIADAVIVATGGLSYPATGCSGDGYRFAKEAGHQVTELYPALVPLEGNSRYLGQLTGLSLRNVEVAAYLNKNGVKQLLAKEFGEMLFTHFGFSGPIILTLSYSICRTLKEGEVEIAVNLKPALSEQQLDERLLRDFDKFSRKHFANSLTELLPASLIPVIVDLSGIAPDKPVNQITKDERGKLVSLLRALPFKITAPRPLDEAIVTAGGIDLAFVNPKDMSSRLTQGLYFAGEVLDIDGMTGGYNLQTALSTGFVAGTAAAAE